MIRNRCSAQMFCFNEPKIESLIRCSTSKSKALYKKDHIFRASTCLQVLDQDIGLGTDRLRLLL